jgi:hypothetical protein
MVKIIQCEITVIGEELSKQRRFAATPGAYDESALPSINGNPSLEHGCILTWIFYKSSLKSCRMIDNPALPRFYIVTSNHVHLLLKNFLTATQDQGVWLSIA